MNSRALEAGYELLNPTERVAGYELAIQSSTHSEFTVSNSIWQLVILNHFGCYPRDLRSIVEQGMIQVTQFFRQNPASDPNTSWHSLLSQVLPPAAIFLPDAQLRPLANQLNVDLDPGYVGPKGPGLAKIYLIVTNAFRERPESTKKVEVEIENSKSKHAQLLLALWRTAALSGQADYDQAMKESLKYVKQCKRPPLDRTFPSEWVATEESMIHAIAERNGKLVPKLPDSLSCYLVTRKTLVNCVFD